MNRSSLDAAPRLVRLIRQAGRVVVLDRVIRSLSGRVLLLFVLLVGAAALDARFELSTPIRVVFLVVFLGAIGVVGIGVWRITSAGRDEVRIARRLESIHSIQGDVLTCAAEFLAKGSELSALERAAVLEAEVRAGGLSAWAVADSGSRWKGGAAAVLLIVCLVVIELLFPGFVRTSLARFAEPLERVEPYTKAEFAVSIEGSQVRVKVIGEEVSRADLVWVSPGGEETRVPMLKLETKGKEDEFALELAGEPLGDSFYIETPAGRSARLSSGQLASRSKSAKGTEGLPGTHATPGGGNPGGEGKGAGEGKGKPLDSGAEGIRLGNVDDGGKLIGGVRLIEEKRDATTRPMTDLDQAQLKDLPSRFRWMVERYLEEKSR